MPRDPNNRAPRVRVGKVVSGRTGDKWTRIWLKCGHLRVVRAGKLIRKSYSCQGCLRVRRAEEQLDEEWRRKSSTE